jgi:sugar-specific transcriptional regulator TrmB
MQNLQMIQLGLEIGLTEREMKTYLGVLELGEASVQGVSNKTMINRPTTYQVINKLMAKGLLIYAFKGKKKFLVAAPPKKLKEIMKEKIHSINQRIEDFNDDALPELTSIYNQSGVAPRTTLYNLEEGITKMRRAFGREKDKFIYSLIPKVIIPEKYRASESFLHRMQKIGKKYKNIYIVKDASDIKDINPERKTRIDSYVLAKEDHVKCEVYLHANTVYIISYGFKPYVIIIEDQNYYNVMKYLMRLGLGEVKKI